MTFDLHESCAAAAASSFSQGAWSSHERVSFCAVNFIENVTYFMKRNKSAVKIRSRFLELGEAMASGEQHHVDYGDFQRVVMLRRTGELTIISFT